MLKQKQFRSITGVYPLGADTPRSFPVMLAVALGPTLNWQLYDLALNSPFKESFRPEIYPGAAVKISVRDAIVSKPERILAVIPFEIYPVF